MSQNQIECPNCGYDIDVSEVLRDQYEKEYQEKISSKKKEFKQMQKELEEKQEEIEDMVQSRLETQLKEKEKEAEEKLKKKYEADYEDQFKTMQEELEEKSGKLKEMMKLRADMSKIQREKEELEDKYKAETELKINEAIKKEKEKLEKQAIEESELKLQEKDLLIGQLKKQLEEASKKANQGSQQAQGEAQELAIEQYLKNTFVYDRIDEIKKGKTGADCLQTVVDNGRDCGTIYYESKRTKSFSKPWIQKLRDDMIDKGADIGVIVTETMPDELERLGLIDGIWICTFQEFKGLCYVLRDSIIKLYHAKISQEDRGTKMGELYKYLTSSEFSMHVEAVVEGFITLKDDMEKEKQRMLKNFKKREKMIDRILVNTNEMFGSINGIAGNIIDTTDYYELTEGDEEEDE